MQSVEWRGGHQVRVWRQKEGSKDGGVKRGELRGEARLYVRGGAGQGDEGTVVEVEGGEVGVCGKQGVDVGGGKCGGVGKVQGGEGGEAERAWVGSRGVEGEGEMCQVCKGGEEGEDGGGDAGVLGEGDVSHEWVDLGE